MGPKASLTTPERSVSGANAKPGSEKGSQPAKAAKRAASDQGLIAQRAYELYEQRGRHEGQDIEDWLSAERQLAGAEEK